ncbi:MAG: class I SAM-dependent methyltransferase [Gammaproteobacteria bacterium]|nr:class I SAM-dependent methyltransferase [Gammaproteobacteria bacterium]MBQ0840970.1 class I SAM-dependent methyltransferase [Gammaproteobacteria bacterium]
MMLSQFNNTTCSEREIYEQLPLDNKNILELGCGKADITRLIATGGPGRHITATEVDEIQHGKNLLIDDLPNVTFIVAGSEKISVDDASFDFIFMFKSLHHVPTELMADALKEVERVLKPGGIAYISEPVFKGDFNEVLRLFHDEELVRAAAHEAIQQAISNKSLTRLEEVNFNSPMGFKNFADFENKIIKVTHTQHALSPQLQQQVEDQFALNMGADGAKFLMPIRVDVLQKKA